MLRTGLLGWTIPMGLILPPPRHLPPLARIVRAIEARGCARLASVALRRRSRSRTLLLSASVL